MVPPRGLVTSLRNNVTISCQVGRPKLHDDVLRGRLLDRAAALVFDGGVDALNLRRLAAAVGTSTSAVYSLFGNKAGLLDSLYLEAAGRFGERLATVHPTDDALADIVGWGSPIGPTRSGNRICTRSCSLGMTTRPTFTCKGLEPLSRLSMPLFVGRPQGFSKPCRRNRSRFPVGASRTGSSRWSLSALSHLDWTSRPGTRGRCGPWWMGGGHSDGVSPGRGSPCRTVQRALS